ncbi:LysM peptidoglycan-binding domain-containing protein [Guggenheimella bovis]
MNISIIDRKKFAIRFGIVLFLCIALIAYLGEMLLDSYAIKSVEGPVTTIVVKPGDTVWSIAKTISSTSDVRALTDEIILINALGAEGKIVPGQELKLPTHYRQNVGKAE